ncbi:MAG: hypothetical protein ABIT38_18080 [Gemmatimonadaceae bacterium]
MTSAMPPSPKKSGALRIVERSDSAEDMTDPLYPALRLAFAPIHKAAFGTATGVAGALLFVSLTVVSILSPRAHEFPLGLLVQFFAGYSVTWGGSIVAGVWGFVVGFVAGWFVAFCRNLALAIVAFTYTARAQLIQTRDFLDHI